MCIYSASEQSEKVNGLYNQKQREEHYSLYSKPLSQVNA